MGIREIIAMAGGVNAGLGPILDLVTVITVD